MINNIQLDQIRTNPASSFWLRDAIDSSLKRDPVDALNDAEILVQLLKARLEAIQESLTTTQINPNVPRA